MISNYLLQLRHLLVIAVQVHPQYIRTDHTAYTQRQGDGALLLAQLDRKLVSPVPAQAIHYPDRLPGPDLGSCSTHQAMLSAMARPIPPVEPVTMAVLPERSMIILCISMSCGCGYQPKRNAEMTVCMTVSE